VADLTIARHDTWPALKATLKQTNESGGEEVINLTGVVKVRFIMKSQTTLVEGNCTGPSGGAFDTTGKVEYLWATGDTAVAGTYELEFEIEWKTTPLEVQSVPNAGTKSVVIRADLGGK
jgi:hypothetical protein